MQAQSRLRDLLLVQLIICMSFLFVNAQEICDNGVDDDGDGLVDLLDIDCLCGDIVYAELVSDFEEYSCCPSGMGQLECLDEDWVQANQFTADYFNECGFMGGLGTGVPAVPLPIPSGSGVLGVMSCDGCHDNAGLCMPFRLIPGEEYDVEFWVGFNEGENLSSNLNVEISIFGSYDCVNLPSTSAECLSNVDGWFEIETFEVTGDMLYSWKQYVGEFTPSQAAEAIAIGTSCDFADHVQSGEYHFLDDIHISGNFLEENDPVEIEFYGDCVSGYFLEADVSNAESYQWYQDGIAMIGETSNPVQIFSDEGYYQVLVQYNNGACSTSESIEVEFDLEVLEADGIIEDLACLGINDGQITVFVDSPNEPFDFQWSNGSNSAMIDGLSPGNYFVTITDDNGCFTIEQYLVDAPLYLDVGLDVQQPTSENLGQAEVFPNGGTPGYSYLWSNGHTESSSDELTPGLYTITVTDDNGCEEIVEFQIYQPLEVIATVTHESCYESCDGTISIEIVGGLQPYDFTWFGIGPDLYLEDLCADGYEYILIDALGTELEGEVDIEEAPEFIIELDYPEVACSADEEFDIELDVDGGIAPLDIEWSNGSGSFDLDNVNYGEYSVTVTDASGCQMIESANIELSPEIEVNAITDTIDCNEGASGFITLEISGGVEPFDVDWSSGHQSQNLNDILPGLYVVTITDDNGCSVEDSITVVANTNLEVLSEVLPTDCPNGFEGSISLDVVGGQEPYTVQWSTGNDGLALINLSVGNYAVTVEDSEGCQFTSSYDVFAESELEIAVTQLDVSCFGMNDGQIELELIDDNPNLSFLWSHGLETQNVEGLTAGSYTVIITDELDCEYEFEFQIEEPEPFVLESEVMHNPCFGDNAGSITLLLENPEDYFVNWENGSTEVVQSSLEAGSYNLEIIDTNLCVHFYEFIVDEAEEILSNAMVIDPGCNDESSGYIQLEPTGGEGPYVINWESGGDQVLLDNLTSGTYTVQIEDSRGCVISETFTLDQQTSIAVQVSESNPSCADDIDGYIDLDISGTAPYDIVWSNGSSEASIQNLAAGVYTVDITDAVDCHYTASFELTAPEEIEANELIIDASCFGEDGSIVVAPLGGTGDLHIEWLNGASESEIAGPSGSYELSITDENGCTEIFNYQINEPDELSINVLNQVFPSNGMTNGSISVDASGGTEPYEYNWSNGDMGSTITDLAFGEYVLNLIDANGCVSEMSFDFDPDPISAFTQVSDNNCFGECQGQIELIIENGVPPYQLLWSDGSSDQLLTDLCNGSYSVEVIDAVGQTFDLSQIEINSPEEIQVQIDVIDESCLSANDGSANINASGGNGSYTYFIGNQELGESINMLEPGQYQLEVVDENGCSIESSFEILPYQLESIQVNFETLPCESSSGVIFLESDNIEQLSFILNDVNIQLEPDNSYLIDQAGNYTLSYLSDNCEVMVEEFSLVEQSVPEQLWNQSGAQLDYGDGLQLDIDSNLFEDIANIEWLISNQFDCIAYGQNDICISVNINAELSEQIVLIITDIYGCEYRYTYRLDVELPDLIEVPNIFSPNGDGENDVLNMFVSSYVSEIKQMRVYDRWGSIVYESLNTHPDNYQAWDGRMNGTKVSDGVYIYFVELVGLDGELYQFSGDLTLIR